MKDYNILKEIKNNIQIKKKGKKNKYKSNQNLIKSKENVHSTVFTKVNFSLKHNVIRKVRKLRT